MRWALVDESGIVQNVIEYDGKADYEPPETLTLKQVNDWIEIGAHIDDAQPAPGLTPEQAASQLKYYAKLALIVTDTVYMRCGKAALPFPSEWQKYTQTLRDIVRTGTGTLPDQPAYPVGT